MGKARTTPVALAVALCAAAVAAAAPTPAHGVAASWARLEPSLVARQEVAAARVGRAIYVVGGFAAGAELTRAVERFEPRTGSWALATPMPVHLNHACAVGWRGDLYVFGGFSGAPIGATDWVSDRLFRYSPRADAWEELEPAPAGRAAHACGVIGSKLYVAAGSTPTAQTTTRLDVFDLRAGRWRAEGPPMGVAREHVGSAVAGKRLYVLGGRDVYGSPNYAVAERFDPRRRRWQRLADMPTARGGFAAGRLGDGVVAAGGEAPGATPTGTLPQAEFFSPGAGWADLPQMPSARHGFGAATVGEVMYVIEGGPITFASVSNQVEALRLDAR